MSFVSELNNIVKAYQMKYDVHIVRNSDDTGTSRKQKPKAIILVKSKSEADKVKEELITFAQEHKRKLKVYVDKVGSDDVLLSERGARSGLALGGAEIKEKIISTIKESSDCTDEEINQIKSLELSDEPKYIYTIDTGINYRFTYFSISENKRIQKSVGDFIILWAEHISSLKYHESTSKQRSDRFMPNEENCVYYNAKYGVYIREKIERKKEVEPTATEVEQPSIPTLRLPVCSSCGGKIVIANGIHGQFLTCENWKEKHCKCNYKLNDYINITY